ncbi:hypothetical protein H9P43_001073 [Blastocladiella emersonii ATCC 22665]|nr:hypothetical protein H9P43_001073 [Blastocladiella emersonii ATCC 22665]
MTPAPIGLDRFLTAENPDSATSSASSRGPLLLPAETSHTLFRNLDLWPFPHASEFGPGADAASGADGRDGSGRGRSQGGDGHGRPPGGHVRIQSAHASLDGWDTKLDRLLRRMVGASGLRVRSVRLIPLVGAGLVFLVGFAAALGLCLWFRSVERRTFLHDFTTSCQITVQSLQAVFAVRSVQYLRNLAAFAFATPELTNEAVYAFGNRSSFDPSLFYNFCLASVIDNDQLPAYEARYNQRVWPSPGNLSAGDQQSVVATFVYWNDTSPSRLLGLNFLSDPLRRGPSMAALATGTLQVSEPLRFVDTNALGIFLCLPVSKREPTATTPGTSWLVTIGLDLHDLFTGAILGTIRSKDEVEPNAFGLRIYYPGLAAPAYTFSPAKPQPLDQSEIYQLSFAATGLDPWRVECIPTRTYRRRFSTVWPWVLFGVVLAVFVVAAELVRHGLKRVLASQQMLREVRAQERLLGTLQDYSKAITQAIPDAMLLLDAHGTIMGANDAALEATGYDMDDLDRAHVGLVLESDESEAPAAAPRESAPGELDEDGVSVSRSGSGGSSSTATTSKSTSPSTLLRPPTLEPGTREGVIRRRDGSTLVVQLSVSVVDDSAESTLASSAATFIDPPPPPTAAAPARTRPQRRRLAQVLLFHDISERAEFMRKAAALERAATSSAQARRNLLEFVVGSVYEPARAMLADLVAGNAALVAAGQPAELDDACEAAQHMVDVLGDVAEFSDVVLPRTGEPAAAVSAGREPLDAVLRAAIAAALAGRQRKVGNKDLHVLVDVQLLPPAAATAAGSTFAPSAAVAKLIRDVVTKTVEVSIGLALPHARWLVSAVASITATTADADPSSSPAGAAAGGLYRRLRNTSSTSLPSRRQPPPPPAQGYRAEITLKSTLSRVAPEMPQSLQQICDQRAWHAHSADGAGGGNGSTLDLTLGSRGSGFGNVHLTFAALLQMVSRIGHGTVTLLPHGSSGALEVAVTLSYSHLEQDGKESGDVEGVDGQDDAAPASKRSRTSDSSSRRLSDSEFLMGIKEVFQSVATADSKPVLTAALEWVQDAYNDNEEYQIDVATRLTEDQALRVMAVSESKRKRILEIFIQ